MFINYKKLHVLIKTISLQIKNITYETRNNKIY